MEGKSKKSYLIWMLKIIATMMVLYIHSANIFGYCKIGMPNYLRPFSMFANTGVPLFMGLFQVFFSFTKKMWIGKLI